MKWLQQKAQLIQNLLAKKLAGELFSEFLDEAIDEVRLELHQPTLALTEGQEHCRMALIHWALEAMHNPTPLIGSSLSAMTAQLVEMHEQARAIENSHIGDKWKE